MCTFQRTGTFQLFYTVRKFVKFVNYKENRYINVSSYKSRDRSNEFNNFDNFLEFRRNQAKRSILVQVKTHDSCTDLLNYCSVNGKVNNLHYYSIFNMNFVVVEFDTVEMVTELLSKCHHLGNEEIIPVRSPLLWFRATPLMQSNSRNNEKIVNCVSEIVLPLSDKEISERMRQATSFSDQILRLYDDTKLNDVSIRLRFLAANQVEAALSGMFGTGKVFPFGSSVNTFGKIGSDLDLVLQFDSDLKRSCESRLIFHGKPTNSSNRNCSQRHMEIIGDLLQYFIPGCSRVIRILHARVPILRYKQDLMGLDCDLSTTNMTAVYMSELLYLYGLFDKRVCPLVFAVRYWAKEINLTNQAPGRWITNFSLTLLVLFYLQNADVIPPIQMLVKHQRSQDERICEDGTDCSFLRDITALPKCCFNTGGDVASLLFNFFQFYSTFDFSLNAISLNTGTIIPKPEYSALYIVNPLEKHLNVSKNVSPEECTHINMECQNAAWLIESSSDKVKSSDQDWGFLYLIKNRNSNKQHRTYSSIKSSTRLMAVRQLFNEKDYESTDNNYKENPFKRTLKK